MSKAGWIRLFTVSVIVAIGAAPTVSPPGVSSVDRLEAAPPAAPVMAEQPALPLESDALRAEDAAREWIPHLARQPGMENWNEAAIRLSSLGPGRHGWLALLAGKGKTIGYMIINARPEGGYRLTGYGPGEVPPDLP